MRAIQFLAILTASLAFFSCKKDNQLRNDHLSEVIDDLPGFWDIKEVQLQAIDDFYTKEAGIFNDTTLFDFGTVEYGDFFIDTVTATNSTDKFSSIINFQLDDLELSARVQSVICQTDACNLFYSSNKNRPNWETKQGKFIQNIFLFDTDYEINFIDRNNVELTVMTEPQRAVQKVILERR